MPPAQVFPLPGVTVDLHNSTESQVVLSSVNLSSTGRYRCEVSGEAPSFQTVTDHGNMIVVALPEDGPKITGGKPRYQIGDTVRVNCTSGRSKPAAQLSWYINGDPADPNFLYGPDKIITGREGLETAVLGLKFRVMPQHFKRGDMKLKCLATIATVYWRSNEESVEGDRPQKAPALESRETMPPSNSRADRVQASVGGCASSFCPCVCLVAVCGIITLLQMSAPAAQAQTTLFRIEWLRNRPNETVISSHISTGTSSSGRQSPHSSTVQLYFGWKAQAFISEVRPCQPQFSSHWLDKCVAPAHPVDTARAPHAKLLRFPWTCD
ncbi:beaten path IIIc [Carabus blaptoides fortunei]